MQKVNSVLFVTYHFPPEVGGIQTRIVGYLTELSRRGIMSTVYIIRPSHRIQGSHGVADSAPALPSRLVKLVRCEGGIRGLFPTAAKVLISVGSDQAEVVHVFTGAATFLGVFTLLVGRMFGHASSMSIFGREDVSQTTRLGGLLLILAGTFATSISTNSASTGKLLPPRFRKKSRVLLGGYAALASQGDLWVDRKSVLYVGRLVKRKGLDDLLNAFKITKNAVPDASLVIVGNGPERKDLEKMADSIGVTSSVHFMGALFGRSLASEYEKCTLCVLPSKRVPDDPATEGLGLALVEAAAYGKPLVGTDHGGISEIITNGVNGFIVPQGNPKRLSEALEALLRDGELAQRMGANSLRIAKSQFTLEAATDRLLESYAA